MVVVVVGKGMVLRENDITMVDRRRMVRSFMVVPHLSHRSAEEKKKNC